MSDQPLPGALPTPRAQTLSLQGLVNRMMRGMLHVPLLSSAIGSRLLTLYVVGRKSGRSYTIPVAYTRDKDDLLIGTPFGWGRNLRTGEQVDILLKGRRRRAAVRPFSAEEDVTRLYAVMCRDNRQFAKFNKIGFDAHGNPEPDDLHLAWAAGARAFRLTPLSPAA